MAHAGPDFVKGGEGGDALHGQAGGDNVDGQRGGDFRVAFVQGLEGGNGDDDLDGGAGDDWVRDDDAQGDTDIVRGDTQGDLVTAIDGDGRDQINGGNGYDVCAWDPGDEVHGCEAFAD